MLRMLRREDRRRLSGRCTITRGTYPDLTYVYDVPCVVRPAQAQRGDVTSGGERLALHLYDVRLPYETDVRRGDTLTITKSRDPQMVDRAITVTESTLDSELTSRTVVAQESVS
jgi:hypothetical protein